MKVTSKAQRTQATPPMVIAVQFDQFKILAALINEQGRALEKIEIDTPHRTTRAAAAEMARMIVSLAASELRDGSPINTIGFSVAGLVDPASSRVSIPMLKGWTRVALKEMIEEELKSAGIDIRIPPDEKRARARYQDSAFPAMIIHSHAAAMASGEAWIGAARGKTNVIYLSIGEDVEAGIILNRRVAQGADGMAGAAGWIALSENFRHEFESRGCLTAEVASSALKRRVIEGWNGDAKSVVGNLIKEDLSQLDDESIIRAARGGDSLALNSVHETCRWIGRAVANLISILNPDAVIIGGSVGLMLKPYLDLIREESSKWAMPLSTRRSRIAIATLGDKAALIGAAKLAFDSSANE